MSDLSLIVIEGRVTQDSVARVLSNGTRIVSFGVAVNESRLDKSTGTWSDTPTFFNVQQFRKPQSADVTYAKGSSVTVSGRMVQDRYQAKDGTQKSRYIINASYVVDHSARRPAVQQQKQSAPSNPLEEVDDPIPF